MKREIQQCILKGSCWFLDFWNPKRCDIAYIIPIEFYVLLIISHHDNIFSKMRSVANFWFRYNFDLHIYLYFKNVFYLLVYHIFVESKARNCLCLTKNYFTVIMFVIYFTWFISKKHFKLSSKFQRTWIADNSFDHKFGHVMNQDLLYDFVSSESFVFRKDLNIIILYLSCIR